jgi:WD40 repeat protein
VADSFDVFFSYSTRDHAAVERVARDLTGYGIRVFLDRWYLTPGQPWPQALEQTLAACNAVAVFIGPEGLGPWQQRERDLALDRQAREFGFPVIPVLLTNVDPALGFLKLNTWVDLSAGASDSTLAILAGAIRGEPPGPLARQRSEAIRAAICPYRGLQPFREEDEPFFFGRTTFAETLTAAVLRQPLIAVVGASGSGKSSVVRAGLIPRLRRGASDLVWDAVTLVPTDRPLISLSAALLPLLEPDLSEVKRLGEVADLASHLQAGKIDLRDVAARVLAKQPGTNRLLVFVDQWEEVYTLCSDASVRQAFIGQLLNATATDAIRVVLTIRGDFMGRVLENRELSDRLQDGLVTIGPMTRSELEETIIRPAAKIGLSFEEGLPETILDDVGEEPGGLPLLEFLLEGLWRERRGNALTHDAYARLGRVSGAIAHRAEDVFEHSLNEAERQTAQRLLIRMVRPGEGVEDTRRRAAIPAADVVADATIQKLAKERLLVTERDGGSGQVTVEVAHEALIRRWQRLRDWINADREFLRTRERIAAQAQLWEEEKRSAERLLAPGRPLAEGEDLLATRRIDLEPLLIDYVEVSAAAARKAEEARQAEQRRHQRTAWEVAPAMIVLTIVAIGGGVLAWWQREEATQAAQVADDQRNVALSGEVAVLSLPLIDEAFDRALLLSAESTSVALTFRARSALFKALMAYPHLHTYLRGHITTLPPGARPHRSKALAFHPTSMMLAAIGGFKSTEIILWGESAYSLQGLPDLPIGVAFSDDGKLLAGADKTGNVIVWDVWSHQKVHSLRTNAEHLNGFALHPKGVMVATVDTNEVRLWDLDKGQPSGNLLKYHAIDAAFSPDGQTLALAALEKIILVDISTRQTREIHAATDPNRGSWRISFSQNGDLVTYANEAVHVFDSKNGFLKGEPLPIPVGGFKGAFALSRSGLFASYIEDESSSGVIIMPNFMSPMGKPFADRRTQGSMRLSYPSYFETIAFSPDNKYIAVYHADDAITLWSLSEARILGKKLLVMEDKTDHDLSYTSTGRLLVVTRLHNKVSVNEPSRGEVFSTSGLSDVASIFSSGIASGIPDVSSNGEWLALVDDGKVRILDINVGRERSVAPNFGKVSAVVFHPQRPIAVVGNEEGGIYVYDVGADVIERVLTSPHKSEIVALAFNMDGTMLASADHDSNARLWNAATGYANTQVLTDAPPDITGFSFSSAKALLAAGGSEGFAVWNTLDGSLIRSFGTGSGAGAPFVVALHPEGSLLAVSPLGSSVEIWDGSGAEKIGPPLSLPDVSHQPTGAEASVDGEGAFQVAFDPKGNSLVADYVDFIFLWDLDPESWRRRACMIANRNLTSDEWQRYFRDRPYHPTCPNLRAPVLAVPATDG